MFLSYQQVFRGSHFSTSCGLLCCRKYLNILRFLQMGFFAEAGPVQIFVSNHVSFTFFFLFWYLFKVCKGFNHCFLLLLCLLNIFYMLPICYFHCTNCISTSIIGCRMHALLFFGRKKIETTILLSMVTVWPSWLYSSLFFWKPKWEKHGIYLFQILMFHLLSNQRSCLVEELGWKTIFSYGMLSLVFCFLICPSP